MRRPCNENKTEKKNKKKKTHKKRKQNETKLRNFLTYIHPIHTYTHIGCVLAFVNINTPEVNYSITMLHTFRHYKKKKKFNRNMKKKKFDYLMVSVCVHS